ncbi:MAG: carbohydrate-binding domain-containing protein [Clostridia bacterium]|nr:carbohydrate-binding domain-containing protein [Clostridia bacterium]
MKKTWRIAIMALAICMIMGAWAAAFAKAESEKSADVGAAFSASSALGSSSTLSTAAATGTPLFQRSDLFSDRDLEQEADLTDAVTYTVADGQEVRITDAGVYVLTGSAQNATVYVEADEKDKVQLVLDGLTITNDDFPAIYVKSADKVFVTTAADSSLAVTGSFAADGDTKADGVIFSKSDLVLNGVGKLTVVSSENGVVSKDDLKITGGTYAVSAQVKAMEANDSIRVADGVLQLTAGTDGLHAENDDDDSKGYIYIGGGALAVTAGDDGIHAATVVQVDDGTLTVTAAEGIEATYVQFNGGVISIESWDDGVNAAQKSSAYRATVEINGGDITIAMSAGDTDGVDANGDIIVNGGTIRVTGSSTFDYDGSAQYNGGTIIANGQQIDYIPNQMMSGRGGMGGWGGGFGGRGRG